MKQRLYIKQVCVALLLAMPTTVVAQGAVPPGHPPIKAPKMTAEEALKEAPKADTSLASLDKAFKETETKLKKSPKDAKAKKAYVDACYKYGHQAMVNGSKSPRILYRAALALYRRALKVDPKHQPSQIGRAHV